MRHTWFVACLLSALLSASLAAQTPTFNVEGVVTDEQQAVLPGVTVTITQRRDRPHPHGDHRHHGTLCVLGAAARRPLLSSRSS